MRLPTALLAVALLAGSSCANPGPLQWKLDDDAELLAVDAAEHERTQLREALTHLRRVHFDYDSAVLTADSRSALMAARLKLGDNAAVNVFIEGHADERGSTEYNISLGQQRGQAVADYLARLGLAPERLHVVSFGEERPLVSASTEAAWAQNRRVDFRIMQGDLEIELARR